MRLFILLCSFAVAFAQYEYDYEPEPEIRRVPRSHPVREYYYDEESEEPQPLEEDMEWSPSEEHCQGHCDYQSERNTNQRYRRVSPAETPSSIANQPVQRENIPLTPQIQPLQIQSAPNPISQHQAEPSNQASTLQQHIIRGKKVDHPSSFAIHQPSNQPYQRLVQYPNQFANNNLPVNGNQPFYLARVNQPNHAPTYKPIPYNQAPQFVGVLHPASVQVSSPVLSAAPGDQSSAAGHHLPQQHSHGHKQGGGRAAHAKFHKQGGEKSTEHFNKDHYVDKGGKGEKVEEVHRNQYEEAGGKKKKHHDNAGHKGSHEEQAHGHKGAKFDEKKGHKKGHKTKGYHNKYHKDEFHKEHKFYDDYHKSGEHHRFGKFNAKHASNESGKKKAHHVDAGHDYVEKGKKGYSNKGHVDADHKGYNGKAGHDEHHNHQSSHGKKGGKEGGSQWAYAKKN